MPQYIDKEKVVSLIKEKRDAAISRQKSLEDIGDESILNEMIAFNLNKILEAIDGFEVREITMVTIKSNTDLPQSKKLMEFLSPESADMHYIIMGDDEDPQTIVGLGKYIGVLPTIPCWSLAALLNYLRKIDFFPDIEADEHSVTMNINYYNEEEAKPLAPVHSIKVKADTLVDACVAMIEKLHEMVIL